MAYICVTTQLLNMGFRAYKGSRNPIAMLMHRNGYDVKDVCRMLRISPSTLDNYINDPTIMRLKEIILLAGLFNVEFIAFCFMLSRHKSKIRTKADKWFLDDIKKSFEDLEEDLNSIE